MPKHKQTMKSPKYSSFPRILIDGDGSSNQQVSTAYYIPSKSTDDSARYFLQKCLLLASLWHCIKEKSLTLVLKCRVQKYLSSNQVSAKSIHNCSNACQCSKTATVFLDYIKPTLSRIRIFNLHCFINTSSFNLISRNIYEKMEPNIFVVCSTADPAEVQVTESDIKW